MVENELRDLMKNKLEDSQIIIPEPLIYEVDKIVTQTGLYSDNIEFVTDAVRRLILESRKDDVNTIVQEKGVHDGNVVKIKNASRKKRKMNSPK